MMKQTVDELKKEEQKLQERKREYVKVQMSSKKFLEEYEQTVRQDQRLLTEINNLLYHSNDRYFFHEQQQLYTKESREVINKMMEETHEIKRQSSRLTHKLDVLGREQEQLEKREEKTT